ncbi:MAG: ribosome small subunit-dependent GTPase A [Gammaproteobacteria bacterium]|nr:ribosome small subunit-dependent GTPase A [Gammaproteobacteria bacterium]MDE0480865.1 ribosome small subunit-dependent GTPase A [Gammaproteobacteria bacterium]
MAAGRRLSERQRRRIAARRDERSGEERSGVIIGHFGRQLEVEDASGKVVRCHARANLPQVVTGDRVSWTPDKAEGGVVTGLEPRRNEFGRADTSARFRPIAANIDCVLTMFATVPETEMSVVDRYLVAIENLGLECLLVLNKIDLPPANPRLLARMAAIYRELELELFELSALTGAGVDALAKRLQGLTAVVVGQSGVGKSSLLNRLGKQSLAEVGELDAWRSGGRHTTTTARLFHLPGFDLIDSPGVREFSLGHLEPSEVVEGFVELRSLAEHCKFRDCSHRVEPGCAVLAAAENGAISGERLRSYTRIVDSLQQA